MLLTISVNQCVISVLEGEFPQTHAVKQVFVFLCYFLHQTNIRVFLSFAQPLFEQDLFLIFNFKQHVRVIAVYRVIALTGNQNVPPAPLT